MFTLAVIAQKGGTGKTTLSVGLAGAAMAAGRTPVIVDLDPQASATAWSRQRGEEQPVVISAQAAVLADALATAAEHGADVAIVDTAPHSERDALLAARAADLVLVPCRAAFLDLQAVEATADLVRRAKARALFVLSQVRPGDKVLPDSAEEHLRRHGLPVSPQRITHRAAVTHSQTAGRCVTETEPEGAAAGEVTALFRIVCEHVNMFMREGAA